jgi:MFS family permease
MMHLHHYKRPPLIGLTVACLSTLVLAWRPAGLPLPVLEIVLAAVGAGIGTVLPVTTVAVQNAVAMHHLGTATGAMNFFRSLGGAIAVAAFGAILLGGIATPGASLEDFRAGTAATGLDVVGPFRHLFLAAALGFATGLGWLVAMEERPLRSGAQKAS